MPSRALHGAAVIGLLAALTACSSFAPPPAPPKLRPGAQDQIGPRLTNYGTAVLPAGATVTVWGDGFVTAAPAPAHPRGKTVTLAGALGRVSGLQVVDHTRPGQTIADGLAALTHGDGGALVVLLYGYGDRATAGPAFKASLDAMIQLAHSRGTPVLLVTEPLPVILPSKTPAAADKQKQGLSDQVSALQEIVRAEASAQGAGLIDSTVVLNPPPPAPNVQNRNALTPAEKEPGSLLATTRIAHAVAGEIELAQ